MVVLIILLMVIPKDVLMGVLMIIPIVITMVFCWWVS